jgi:hypothetical protein
MLRLECALLGRDEVEHHADEDADKSKVAEIDIANVERNKVDAADEETTGEMLVAETDKAHDPGTSKCVAETAELAEIDTDAEVKAAQNKSGADHGAVGTAGECDNPLGCPT